MNYKNIIINELKKMNMKLGIAESVTGGMITSALVDVPGASNVLKGGVVSYTGETKNKLLGVGLDTIDKYGEVSSQVAKEMAMGIRNKLKTDFSIAVTGEAGPFEDGRIKTCLVYFCIIVVDKAYEYEMTTPDEGRMSNRITIASKVIEELFKLIYKLKSENKVKNTEF
ncbi:CinA family protein [Malacoplasma muris]|uniref:CinA family protein n=1 Tax=Malacoplasma muris TaxID=2119 RepID=UPI00398EFBC2